MKKVVYMISISVLYLLPQQAMASTVYQAGTLAALMSGVYYGSTSYKQLKREGDFGLGTGNGVAGEMVEVSGRFYLANDAKGDAHQVSLSMKTPFAMTTNFHAYKSFQVKNVRSVAALKKLIGDKLHSNNIFYAIKVVGTFDKITARSILPHSSNDNQMKLAALVKKYQRVSNYRDVKAELIIFKSPPFSSPISLAGYHIHFITANHKKAGHVYELAIKDAKVEIEPLTRLTLQLPKNKMYLEADIDPGDSKSINKTENG